MSAPKSPSADDQPRERSSTIERASSAFFDDSDLYAPPPFEGEETPKQAQPPASSTERAGQATGDDFLSQPLSALAEIETSTPQRGDPESSSDNQAAPSTAEEPFSLGPLDEPEVPHAEPVVSPAMEAEAPPADPDALIEPEVRGDDHRRSVILPDEESSETLPEPEPTPLPVGDARLISLQDRLVDPALIHIDEHRQPIATPLLQDYRRIKRPLLLNVRNNLATGRSTQGANIILVTSARPSEGKSTVATNLAVSIATELDYYALLVDADVHSATVSRTMGVRDRLGLSDVLTRPEVSLPDTLVHTEWQNLSVLPSGPEVNNIDELYASQAMYDLCSELWQRYEDRIIVVDSAPILVGGEPQILARMVGQIVMVVEADTTPQHIVLDALGQLPNPDKVGFVLNKASRNIGNQDYGYYRSVT